MAEQSGLKNPAVDEIQKKYTHGKTKLNLPYEKTWFITHAFKMGQHYITYNDVNRTFITPPQAPEHRKRAIVNWIFAHHQRAKSKLSAGAPLVTVYPATSEQNDIDRASISTLLIDFLWQINDVRKKRAKMVDWALTCGSAFYHIYWDDTAGPQAVDEESGDCYCRGDVRVDVVAPFEIVADPSATEMDAVRWLIWSKARPVSWVKDHYPKAKKLDFGMPDLSSSMYERKMRDVIGVFGFMHWGELSNEMPDGSDEDKTVLVHQYFERPSTKHPQGRMVVIAGDHVLLDRGNPYGDIIPFVKFDEIEVAGRFWGMSTSEQMIPLNRNLNKARSEQMENRVMSRPKWLIPRICNVSESSFTDEAGEAIEYDHGPNGEHPEIQNPAPPSSSHIEDIRQTMLEIQDVSGYHEATRGILPSSETSGKAVQLLQLADDSRVAATMRQLERADEDLSRMMLRLARLYYDTERMVRVVGKDNQVRVERIRGEDIEGQETDADYYDVRIKEGSGFLRDKDQIRREVEWSIQVGLLNPVQNPQDKKKIEKMLEMGSNDPSTDETRLDTEYAQQENELIAQGQQPIPMHYEDHEIHLAEHRKFRKTSRYRDMVGENPELDQEFDAHDAGHVQLMMMFTGGGLSPAAEGDASIAGGESATDLPQAGPELPFNE